jgi:hypothetical protein
VKAQAERSKRIRDDRGGREEKGEREKREDERRRGAERQKRGRGRALALCRLSSALLRRKGQCPLVRPEVLQGKLAKWSVPSTHEKYMKIEAPGQATARRTDPYVRAQHFQES